MLSYLIDEMENDWVPQGHPVLDLVPPEFKVMADKVFIQNLGCPDVDKDSLWVVYMEMRNLIKEELRYLPASFKADMKTVLRENEKQDEEELPLLEGYNRLRGRPNCDSVRDGDLDGIWDGSSDDESDDYEEALYEVEITDDET